MSHTVRKALLVGACAGVLLLAVAACSSASPSSTAQQHATAGTEQLSARQPYLDRFHAVSQLASTVPANGDVNPYGVTVVPASTGKLIRGDVLVSNFNDKANIQGTGTTIMQVAPDGTATQFARITALPASMHCPGGVGLTTALTTLPGGWVVVGSLPTTSSGALPADNPLGCLIVLNSQGQPTETWTDPQINGPWDLTSASVGGHQELFVANTLSRAVTASGVPAKAGTCAVIRLSLTAPAGSMPRLGQVTVIGQGYPWLQNKSALVQGPTGVAMGRNGTLYVASTLSNSITAIPDAATRTAALSASSHVLTSGGALSGPLGLTWTPAGDLIAVNGNNGVAVEITPAGHQVATKTLVPNGAGDLFGVTPTTDGQGLLFVNDGTNALDLLSG
jgi:hypothetical protein